MADLHIDWMKPIRLPMEGKHSLTIETGQIPDSAGVYIFFRRVGKNTTEVVYVGKADNLRKRANWHRNNHALITTMIAKKGTYYLMPGKFKALPGQISKTSVKTIERVLIQACIEDEHPLINVQGVRIRTQHVISTLPAGAKFLNKKIGFEPKKAPAKKATSRKRIAAKK